MAIKSVCYFSVQKRSEEGGNWEGFYILRIPITRGESKIQSLGERNYGKIGWK